MMTNSRRWHANKASASRGWGNSSQKGERTAKMFDGKLLLGVCKPHVLALHATLYFINVAGRSDAHVDRLARDWIGHGVTPCKNGKRGVAGASSFEVRSGFLQHCEVHVFGQWNSFCHACVQDENWRRGERRAFRVVAK
jgi:hypothetical protein